MIYWKDVWVAKSRTITKVPIRAFGPETFLWRQIIVEIANFYPACLFNDGFFPMLNIMETMGVIDGLEAVALAESVNSARTATDRRCVQTSKEAPLARRNVKVTQNELFEKAEGIMYTAGIGAVKILCDIGVCCQNYSKWPPRRYIVRIQLERYIIILGTKVNSMASRVKGLVVCL